jgi:hypothetical protein
MVLMGRSGHFEAGSDLAHAMCDGWAASVTLTKADVSVIEDTFAVLSRYSTRGQ